MFEWKEILKRFHYAQYDERKLIRDLQLHVDDVNAVFKLIADEFDSGAGDDLESRVAALELAPPPHIHDDRYYTESEINSLLSGKSDIGHDHDSRYYTKSEIDALIPGTAPDAWAFQPIGVPVGLQDDIAGVAAPSLGLAYRYIKLSRLDAYNTGVLTGESQTGVAPNLIATATIDLPASPLHGQTVALINTDRRFLRAGSPGTKEQSQNLSHGHTGSANSAGAHSHGVPTGNAAGSGGLFAGYQFTGYGVSSQSAGAHGHSLTIDANGGTEARPANIGVTYFMRIL